MAAPRSAGPVVWRVSRPTRVDPQPGEDDDLKAAIRDLITQNQKELDDLKAKK